MILHNIERRHEHSDCSIELSVYDAKIKLLVSCDVVTENRDFSPQGQPCRCTVCNVAAVVQGPYLRPNPEKKKSHGLLTQGQMYRQVVTQRWLQK